MIDIHQLYWAAGFLDGEGHFSWAKGGNGLRVEGSQVGVELLERLQALFGGRVGKNSKPTSVKHNQSHHWYLCSKRAAGLMMTLYPIMSQKRKSEIVRALSTWKMKGRDYRERLTCPSGHPYDTVNTLVGKAGVGVNGNALFRRGCRICHRVHMAAYRKRNPNEDRKRYAQNREGILVQRKEFYAKHRERICKQKMDRYWARRGKEVEAALERL